MYITSSSISISFEPTTCRFHREDLNPEALAAIVVNWCAALLMDERSVDLSSWGNEAGFVDTVKGIKDAFEKIAEGDFASPIVKLGLEVFADCFKDLRKA